MDDRVRAATIKHIKCSPAYIYPLSPSGYTLLTTNKPITHIPNFTMMYAAFTSLIAATSVALASPVVPRTGDWCSGLGITYDTSVNFTLTALNTTLPNANSTGVPLVGGQNGAADEAEFEVLSVRSIVSSEP